MVVIEGFFSSAICIMDPAHSLHAPLNLSSLAAIEKNDIRSFCSASRKALSLKSIAFICLYDLFMRIYGSFWIFRPYNTDMKNLILSVALWLSYRWPRRKKRSVWEL